MIRSVRLAALALLALLAVVVPVLLSQAPAMPKRYALVVGINEYEHADLAALKVAENDALVLAKELEGLGYSVVRLVGKEATKSAIEKGLHTICEKARKGDLVLVALSGHGVQFEQTDVACFCPVDAKPFKNRAETLVSMGKVYQELEECFATDKLLLIDACRNDPGVRGRSGIEAKSAPVPFGVAALYGCAPGQKAMEDEKLGHGLFMHSVLAGLRGAAIDPETGEVDFAGLGRYVQKQTPARAATLPGSPRQTPTLEARYVSAPVLVPKSSSPVVVDAKPLKAPFGEKEIREARAAWAKKLNIPAEPELDLGGGVKMQFVLIPPGEFDMGSADDDKDAGKDEKPRRRVTLTQAFYLQTTETTQEQYVKLTGKANPSYFSPGGEGKDAVQGLDTSKFPVETVDHTESLAACQAAAVAARTAWLPVKWSGVLPREGEWEYACRAGSGTKYHFGDDAKDLGRYAWSRETSEDRRTDTVGVRLPNGFGLYDMHGNVYEWCEDWYDEQYYDRGENANPRGSPIGSGRVVRGGSFFSESWNCRAANRVRGDPARQKDFLGFRVCFRPD